MQQKINLKTAEVNYQALCSSFVGTVYNTENYKDLYRNKKLYRKAKMKAMLPHKDAVTAALLAVVFAILAGVLIGLSLTSSIKWIQFLEAFSGEVWIYNALKKVKRLNKIRERNKTSRIQEIETLEYYLKSEFRKKESEFLATHLLNMAWDDTKEFVSKKKDMNKEVFDQIEHFALMRIALKAIEEIIANAEDTNN